MKNWTLSIAFLFFLMLSSCSSQIQQNKVVGIDWFPLPGFQESDLIGIWKSEWQEGPSLQILVFRDDHTFSQTYILNSSGREFVTRETWFIVNTTESCTYIHADGMRCYYGID